MWVYALHLYLSRTNVAIHDHSLTKLPPSITKWTGSATNVLVSGHVAAAGDMLRRMGGWDSSWHCSAIDQRS